MKKLSALNKLDSHTRVFLKKIKKMLQIDVDVVICKKVFVINKTSFVLMWIFQCNLKRNKKIGQRAKNPYIQSLYVSKN